MNPLRRSLILCGFTSSGKSAVGVCAANRLHIPFHDTDTLLAHRHAMSVQTLYATVGPERFRDLEHEIALEAASLPLCVLSTGGGMLAYERNARILKAAGTIVLIDRPFDAIWESLSRTPERPLLKGRSQDDVRRMYEERMRIYRQFADCAVPNLTTVEDCAARVVDALRQADLP